MKFLKRHIHYQVRQKLQEFRFQRELHLFEASVRSHYHFKVWERRGTNGSCFGICLWLFLKVCYLFAVTPMATGEGDDNF